MTARRRPVLPFRSVNRRGSAHYDPSLQRHHLLPRQLLARRCFARLIGEIGSEHIGFEDFRRNGMLLPAREDAVVRLTLPLHRGPHRDYSAMVAERVGTIEMNWARARWTRPDLARERALAALALLQDDLRLGLLRQRGEWQLHRRDPLARAVDFSSLDDLAELLWQAV